MSDDTLWEDGGSVFRPSYSATWLNCLGSLQPSRYANDTAGIDAAVGTVFHSLMAEWQQVWRPDDWLDKSMRVFNNDKTEFFDVTIDEEMFVNGEECLRRYADIPGDRFVETRVDISDLTPIPNQGGTADLAICSPGVLDIIDWKYGRGVQVFAENNTQLLLYAWGFFKEYDCNYWFERIRLHIAQPRLGHFDVWEITRDELIEFAAFAKERAHEGWKPGAPRSPSPKACQWCKIRTTCTALEAAREAIADQTFDVLDEPITMEDMAAVKGQIVSVESVENDIMDGGRPSYYLSPPDELSTSDLARIYGWRKIMESWFADIGEELTTRALHGDEVPGWKITQGRSRRKWGNDDEAVEKLSLLLGEDQIFVRKLVSPNQAETLLKPLVGTKLAKQFVGTAAVKPQGKPTLAPDGDNRSEIPSIVDQSFEGEDEL